MTDPNDPVWGQFEKLGVAQVRKNLGLKVWGERNEALARQWLDHREASESSDANQAALAEARSANDLAREANAVAREASSAAHASNALADAANSLAARALARASTNNKIAVIAAIIAAAALAVSLFKK